MSFKRAGDDHCALRLQKKQRVAELFAEDIAADEVSQNRSGKYICLVCPHNPVLDTMPMLAIHRQGKKHLTNMSIKIEKEHNLNELLQKQKQEVYLKEASVINKPSSIEKNTMEPLNGASETAPLLAKTRQLTESITRKSADESQVEKFKDKSVGFGNKKTVECQRFMDEQSGQMFKKNKPFFQSRVEMRLSRYTFDKQSTATLDKTTNNEMDHTLNTGEGELSKTNSCSRIIQGSKRLEKDPKTTDFQQATECNSGTKMNRQQQKKYLEMKMSGWILDSNGKWIKDENVEFDSDEEEPPATMN